MTLPVLTRIIQALPHVCKDHYEVALFHAVMLCAFFCFMRISEFAAVSKTNIQSSLILASDVEFTNLGQDNASVLVTFRYTKNNQMGTPQIVELIRSGDETICPVRALTLYAQMRPKREGSFFFVCHFGGDPLTQYQFNATLKQVLIFLGLGGSPFSAHSFRIGAASTAALLGFSFDEVKAMGRWRSDAAQLYIRPIAPGQPPGV